MDQAPDIGRSHPGTVPVGEYHGHGEQYGIVTRSAGSLDIPQSTDIVRESKSHPMVVLALVFEHQVKIDGSLADAGLEKEVRCSPGPDLVVEVFGALLKGSHVNRVCDARRQDEPRHFSGELLFGEEIPDDRVMRHDGAFGLWGVPLHGPM